jgi:TIR domain
VSDLFISYASEDRERLVPLVAALEAAGWSVFWDREIPTGQTWRQVLARELSTARATVVVWSRDSVISEWVQDEAEQAKARKTLFPVLLDDVDPPLGFGGIQAIKLIDWDGLSTAPGLQQLLQDLRAALAGDAKAGSAPSEREPERRTRFTPPWTATTVLKTVGACAVALAMLSGPAGWVVERSYDALLGITLETSVSEILFSGARFFLTLFLVAFEVCWPFVAAVASAVLLVRLLRRMRNGGQWPRALRSLYEAPWALNALQVLAYFILLLYAVSPFADLLPMVTLEQGEGLSDAVMARLQNGHALHRHVVLIVAASLLLLAGIRQWTRALRGSGRLAGTAWTISQLLSIPLYVVGFLEVMMLPVAHGLLRVPSSREHALIRVSFKPDLLDADLRGRELLLVQLPSTQGKWTFYCPRGPRGPAVWSGVGADQIQEHRRESEGTLVALLPAFAGRTSCQATDVRIGTADRTAP